MKETTKKNQQRLLINIRSIFHETFYLSKGDFGKSVSPITVCCCKPGLLSPQPFKIHVYHDYINVVIETISSCGRVSSKLSYVIFLAASAFFWATLINNFAVLFLGIYGQF
ncbi:hypothetical protein HN51_038537 [Arachis hypogaea]